MNVKKVIKKLPFPINRCTEYIYGAIPPRLRYGKTFWDTYNFLQESQWWSRKELEDYQMQELSKLLNHAYENVPYYRKVFDERGLKPKGIQSFDDLKKLPYLTKNIIRENLRDLIVQNLPKSRLEYETTGGSSGIPLGFYQESGLSFAREWAFMITLWNRVGFKISDKRVMLRGNVIQSASKGKFWEYNPIKRILILSSYHMTNETLPKYIKKIRNFQPDFFHAYPSTITILARFMKENNIEPFPSVKALICSSENFYSWQRELLEDTFRCRVFSFYGHSENAVLAGECEKNNDYHIFPEYGLVELINKYGNPISKEGEMGEITATGFNNYVLPFIRYKTGDIAVYSKKKCSCGRNYPLLKNIEGRLQEFFIDKTGSLITFTCSDEVLWSVKDKINAYQYVQNEPGKVLLNIDARINLPISDIQSLKKNFMEYYSGLDVEINFVKNIPRTKSGKFRYLIQKLPIEFGETN